MPSLLLLRPPGTTGDAPGWLVVLLVLLAFGTWIGVDRLQAGPDAVFYIYTVPAVSWYALVLLSAGTLFASLCVPRAPVRATVGVMCALAVIFLALLALEILATPPPVVMTLLSIAYLVYAAVVLARSLRSCTGRGQPRAMTVGVLFLLGAGYLTNLMYVDPGMWFAGSEEDYTAFDDYLGRGERLLFEQPSRIDRSVAAVAPSSDGTPDVYFLGFAGYGEERVFAEEIRFAAQVVGKRYAAERRQVLLLNDRRDLDSTPIATATSLEYALQALVRRMNVDEDVLFLALSSHGSDGSLAVSNGPLMLQDLAAEDLADSLRNSGIRWRVIVISACHAGSFIDALRDPETIIIAAAAADRTSFGCSDERELTHFGEAFYRDALPGAASLRAAFDSATAAIGRREQREARRASQPQAHFGEALERHLAAHFDSP